MTSRSRRDTQRALRRTIDALDDRETKRVLGALLDARPDLLPEAAALASSDLATVSVERVAEDIAQTVGALRIEDVWDRPRARHEDDTEGAWAAVEDAVEPFVRDIERRIRLGRDQEALGLCQGTLLGLYRVHETQGDAFLDGFAPDAIGSIARWVARTWRKSGGRTSPRRASDRSALRVFIAKSLPDWKSFLTTIIGKELKKRAMCPDRTMAGVPRRRSGRPTPSRTPDL